MKFLILCLAVFLINADSIAQRKNTDAKDTSMLEIIDLKHADIEKNSDLFKIGELDGQTALYIKGNEYKDKIDDVRGKVALIGKIRRNYSMSAELKFLGHHMDMENAGWFGVVFRAADTENFEVVWFMPGSEGSNTVAYVPVAHGLCPWWTEAYSAQEKGSAPILADKWFRARIDVTGDEFTLYVDNDLVFTKKMTYYLNEGHPGFFIGTATDAAIRNITIKDLPDMENKK